MRAEIHTGVLAGQAAIMVADARPRVHQALQKTIAFQTDLRVVGLCETSHDTCLSLRRNRPDVLLLDWQIPDSGALTLLGRLHPGPDLSVILLTDERDPDLLAEALILGARGAISRTAPPDTLLRCMRAVLRGEIWFSRSVTRALRDRITSDGTLPPGYGVLQGLLTPRETDVVRCVGRGRANREIAAELGISHQTVRHHLKSVFGKLHVSSRLELALLADRDRL